MSFQKVPVAELAFEQGDTESAHHGTARTDAGTSFAPPTPPGETELMELLGELRSRWPQLPTELRIGVIGMLRGVLGSKEVDESPR